MATPLRRFRHRVLHRLDDAQKNFEELEAALQPGLLTVYNVLDYGANDDTAAIQAAVTAANQAGGGIIYFPPGDYVLSTPVLVPPTSVGLVFMGAGREATTFLPTTMAFKLARSADYDLFANLVWEDFTIDAGNHSGNDALLGCANGDANAQRINIKNVRVRRIATQNVNISKGNVKFQSIHPGADEATATVLNNIAVEDCDFIGGNSGAVVTGAADGSYQVNVGFDLIRFENCTHDFNVVPTSSGTGANFQVGAWGWGDRVRIINCHGANSVDLGIEVDGAQDSIVRDCTVLDPWNSPFTVENFHTASDVASQRYVFENCRSSLVNTSNAVGFGVGGGVNPIGHQILKDCSLYTQATAFTKAAQAIYGPSRAFHSLTIDGFRVVADALADTSTGTKIPTYFDIYPSSDCVLTMRRIQFEVSGSTTNASNNPQLIRLGVASGKTMAIDIDGVEYNLAITGIGSQKLLGIVLPAQATGTLRGQIKGVDVVNWSADTDGRPIVVNSTASGTIDRLRISNSDFSKVSGASRAVIIDATQKPAVFLDRIRPKTTPATTATITPSGSPFSYQNLDGYSETVTVQGGTVTKIEQSNDGSTFIDTGATAGTFQLNNADYLKVTYTGAPTMKAIFSK